MAGIFGFFNFEKEGPGIDKNAPKKKAFIVFFETFFRNFWKFITINLVYTLISLPILTNGLSAVGITHVTRNTARDKHSFGLSDFFETIKKNWKQALPAGILNAIIYICLIFAAYFYFSSEGIMSTIGLGITLSALLIFTMMNMYIWTLMITFKFSFKQIYKNSYKFAFISLFKNFLCLLCLGLVYVINILILILAFNISINAFVLVSTVLAMLYILTYPSFKFLLIQYFTFSTIKKYIIDPYYLEHPDEDIDKRRDLGIEIESEDDNDDDNDDGNDDGGEDDQLIFNY